jgi:hypothetical protein
VKRNPTYVVIVVLFILGGMALVPDPVRGMEAFSGSAGLVLNASETYSPAAVPEGVALVAGDTIDLTWRPEEFPAGTFIRLEIYRGFSTDALNWIATVNSPTVWRFRDTGLMVNTTYIYRAVLYYYPSSSPDDERSTTVFTDSANTGTLAGSVYESLVVQGGVYELGNVTVYDGAILTIPASVKTKTSGSIYARDGHLRVDGAAFDVSTNIVFGDDSPAMWGEGWVRGATLGDWSEIFVYGDHAVEISNSDFGAYGNINAGGATGYVVVGNNTGDGDLSLGGAGSARDNTFGRGRAYGSATLENNVFETMFVYNDATARFNRVTGKTSGRGTATLENNVLGELSVSEEALARYNDVTGDVEIGGSAYLEYNMIVGNVAVDDDASQVTLLQNVISQGKLVVANDYSCEISPATAYVEGNTITAPSGGSWAVEVSGGAHVTMINNEIEGGIEVTQECTQFTAHQNVIDGGLSICWTPAITVTENLLDGGIYVGSGFPLTCSGDASGTIARNTIQNNYGEYSPALYLSRRLYTESHAGLSVQHNCLRNNTIAARLYTVPEHGLVDLRNNWWGDASGPDYSTNPGGAGGRIENGLGAPLAFDPWDAAPTYCQDAMTIARRPGDIQIEMPETVRPDGTSQALVQVTVYDQYGWPLPNASVGFMLIPEGLGQFSQDAATTDDYGQASVWYTAPALNQLGSHGEVEVRVFSGAAQDWGTISFEKPDVLHTAEPRYHEDGWSEWHALLPPDSNVQALLSAKLTYNGEPVRNYTVTLEIDPLDGGIYDGVFVEGSEVIPPLDDHQVTLLTDDDGELWVKYRYVGQASRYDAVRDGVELGSDAFGHLASWEVETGMDLEIVDIRRPGSFQNDYLVMGKSEPMEIVVRDRLHPDFYLSNYNDNPDTVTNPMLSVWLDVSDAATIDEFFDLLMIDHFRIPGEWSYVTSFELAGDDQVYLRTFEGEHVAGRPVIVPRFEGWNVYWVGIHLRRNSDGLIIRDTYPRGQTDNNYEVIRFQANADMTAWELFLRDNPCAPNTPWGRAAKCTLNIMTWFPATKVQAEVASTLLALCETMFNIANGRTEDAALGAAGIYGGQLGNYLEAHPEVLEGTRYGPGSATTLGTLGNVAKVIDCYNALTDWTGDLPLPAGFCGLQARTAPHATESQPNQTAIWVQGLLQSLDEDLDALAILGTQQTSVVDAVAGQTVVTSTNAMTDTAGTYFSVVNDLGSIYLLPKSTYSVTLQTITDTQVILFRRGITMTNFSTVLWEDAGNTPRQIGLSFGPTQTISMQVDEGGDGSIDRTVDAVVTPHLVAPFNVQVTQEDEDSVRVTWDAVDGAARYHVYHGTESRWMPLFETYPNQVVVYADATSKVISGLELAGWAHFFAVTMVDDEGNESLYSSEATAGRALRPRPLYLPLVMR